MGDANRGAVETSQGDAAPRLLQLVEELVLELHPHRRGRLRLTLQSSLDRDLAIDSLGLAELLNRIENTFRVRLPDDLLARANTVGELLAAIGPRVAPATEVIAPVAPAPQPASPTPLDASTLTEILDRLSRERPDNLHVLFPDRTTHPSRLTYSDLAQGARSVAAGLLARGLAPGDRVALMLPTGPDFFLGFFGALYAGAVPVPIYPPLRMSQIEEHLRRQAGILNNAEAAALITMDEARTVATLLRGQVPSLRIVDTVEHLAVGQAASPPRRDDPNATVFLQYTSGSTGDPKGVVITHNNLLANLNAIRDRFGPGPSDVIVSWLPLYHDMGLIGAWLASLAFGIPAVILSPLTFLTRPQEWLWAIHRHRGTYSGGPNFGFELCLRKIPDEAIEGLDLSSLRHMANGAEPINASTIRRFTERFAKYGFRPDAMRPVYGMAENTLGLSIPLPGSVPVIDRIARDPLAKRGEAVAVAQPAGPPSGSQGATALEVVGCGPVLKGNEVRIIGSNGRELPERREGRLQFRGPSSTQGYFRNEAKTRELMDGDWRESGDLAYIAGGEIFVTGRSKDIIIRAGRNIHPHELEAAVGDIDGIRKGCVAALGIADATAGTEKIVIVAETREEDASARTQLEDHVAATVAEFLDTPPEKVLLVPPHTVPKTSSGKLRRAAMKEYYERGQIGSSPRALWWQLTRLSTKAFLVRAKQRVTAALTTLYGVYWWLVATPLLLSACLWTVVAPLPAWRWAALRVAARAVLWLTAIPLTISGREKIPKTSAVMVANHTSYFDVLVITAALGGPMVFVAKKEYESQWLIALFLRRIGSIFVERSDAAGGVEDTETIMDVLRQGGRVFFFPEGTFVPSGGLLPFRGGAFVAAAEARAPVVPITIRGLRSILRDESWLPRPGRVSVEVEEPLIPREGGFHEAIRLRDEARRAILSRCGEADLGHEHIIFLESGIERLRPDDG